MGGASQLSNDSVETSPVPKKRWRQIMSHIDRAGALFRGRQAGTPSGRERREHPRYPFNNLIGVMLEVGTVPESLGRYLVRSWNLSSEGLCFLHSGTLPTDTPCMVYLVTKDKETMMVTARVVRCRKINERVHEVGLGFDRPVDPAWFAVRQGS